MENTSVNNANTQTQSVPDAAGINAVELQAELERVKKESEGRLRDLQAERSKRQELELRNQPPASSTENTTDVNQDELGKVLNPYIAPVVKKTEEIAQNYYHDKAKDHLVNKTGKTWDDLQADISFQNRMVQTVRKWGLQGNTYDVTVKAYELMQLEDLKVREADRARASNAANNASLPNGTAPAPVGTGREYTSDEFNGMSKRVGGEYDVLSQKGTFRKVGDKFVYTPRS